jgi:hypothetical protein
MGWGWGVETRQRDSWKKWDLRISPYGLTHASLTHTFSSPMHSGFQVSGMIVPLYLHLFLSPAFHTMYLQRTFYENLGSYKIFFDGFTFWGLTGTNYVFKFSSLILYLSLVLGLLITYVIILLTNYEL